MTADELKAALAKLDLTPGALAKILGADNRTVRRWVTGGKAIPDTVAAQVAAMIEAGGVTLEMAAELQASRPRETQPASRFLWVKVKGNDPVWTVAEHDPVNDFYYLPGKVHRYLAAELDLGIVILAPKE